MLSAGCLARTAIVTLFCLTGPCGLSGQERGMENRPSGNRRPGANRPVERNALRAGQLAPTFTLQSLAGEENFDLRTFRGQRPVILVFGSYS